VALDSLLYADLLLTTHLFIDGNFFKHIELVNFKIRQQYNALYCFIDVIEIFNFGKIFDI